MPDSLTDDPGFVAVVENLLSSAEWTSREYVVEALAEAFPDCSTTEIEGALDEMLDCGQIEPDGECIGLN